MVMLKCFVVWYFTHTFAPCEQIMNKVRNHTTTKQTSPTGVGKVCVGFSKQELRVPFELASLHLKDWWFCRYLFWYAVACERGGWMKAEYIQLVCASLGLDYNRERQAIYLAEAYIERDSHGTYKFKSLDRIMEGIGVRVTKSRGGGSRIQTTGMVVFMTQTLAKLNSKRFRSVTLGSSVKIACEKGAKHGQMVNRFRKQLKEKGYWDNWVTDPDTGERYLTKGTLQQLRDLSYCYRTNHGVTIPLTEEEIQRAGIQEHHLKPYKNTKYETENGKVTENGNPGDGIATESCVTPARCIGLALCTARFTCLDSIESEMTEKGYYATVVTASPLIPDMVKATPTRVHIGRPKKKPWGQRPGHIERRYRKYHFTIFDQSKSSKPKQDEPQKFEPNHAYHIYDRCLSYRNIAKMAKCSPTMVMNHASHDFSGTTASKRTVTVLGNWDTGVAEAMNAHLRKLPLGLQSMVLPMKADELRKLLTKKGTAVKQLGLTGFIDYEKETETVMVMRSKTCFTYLEEREITKRSIKVLEKSGFSKVKGIYGSKVSSKSEVGISKSSFSGKGSPNNGKS